MRSHFSDCTKCFFSQTEKEFERDREYRVLEPGPRARDIAVGGRDSISIIFGKLAVRGRNFIWIILEKLAVGIRDCKIVSL